MRCDGPTKRSPLKLGTSTPTEYKLVTFVPASAVDAVSEKLFAAGAGRIGNYQSCSFRTPGTGTFFGGEGSNPAVGQAGRLERVEEVRLETIASIKNVDRVVGRFAQRIRMKSPRLIWFRWRPADNGRNRSSWGTRSSN